MRIDLVAEVCKRVADDLACTVFVEASENLFSGEENEARCGSRYLLYIVLGAAVCQVLGEVFGEDISGVRFSRCEVFIDLFLVINFVKMEDGIHRAEVVDDLFGLI